MAIDTSPGGEPAPLLFLEVPFVMADMVEDDPSTFKEGIVTEFRMTIIKA